MGFCQRRDDEWTNMVSDSHFRIVSEMAAAWLLDSPANG